jgi:hypothetical protein
MSPNSTSAGGSTLASEGPGLGPAGPATPAGRAVRRDRRRGRSGRRRSGGADDEIRLVRVFSPVGKPIGVLAYLVKSMQSTYGTIGTTCNDLKLSYPTFFPAPGGPGAARRTPRTSRVIGTLLPGGGANLRTFAMLGGGSDPPSKKFTTLGGSDPPST